MRCRGATTHGWAGRARHNPRGLSHAVTLVRKAPGGLLHTSDAAVRSGLGVPVCHSSQDGPEPAHASPPSGPGPTLGPRHAGVLGMVPRAPFLSPSWPCPASPRTPGLIAFLCVKFLPTEVSQACALQFIFENKKCKQLSLVETVDFRTLARGGGGGGGCPNPQTNSRLPSQPWGPRFPCGKRWWELCPPCPLIHGDSSVCGEEEPGPAPTTAA